MRIQALFGYILLTCTIHCYPMRHSRVVHSMRTRFIPLLSATGYDLRALAAQLRHKKLSVADYITQELHEARKKVFDSLQKEWRLSNQDIEKTQRIRRLVQAADHKAFTETLTTRLPIEYKQFQSLYDTIDDIMHDYGVKALFDLDINPATPLTVKVMRPLQSLVVELNNQIIIGFPQQIPIPPPTILIGSSFDELSTKEKRGALAHFIGGRLGLEHQTERYLLQRLILAKGKLSTIPLCSYEDFVLLQTIEADVIPGVKGRKIARQIYAWLKALYELGSSEQYLPERAQNMATIYTLLARQEGIKY